MIVPITRITGKTVTGEMIYRKAVQNENQNLKQQNRGVNEIGG